MIGCDIRNTGLGLVLPDVVNLGLFNSHGGCVSFSYIRVGNSSQGSK